METWRDAGLLRDACGHELPLAGRFSRSPGIIHFRELVVLQRPKLGLTTRSGSQTATSTPNQS